MPIDITSFANDESLSYAVASIHPLNKHTFNCIQACMHHMIHPQYQIFANAMIVHCKDVKDNDTGDNSTETIAMIAHHALQSTMWIIARGAQCTEMLRQCVHTSKPMVSPSAVIQVHTHEQATLLKQQVGICEHTSEVAIETTRSTVDRILTRGVVVLTVACVADTRISMGLDSA
jgi:hypothetical protein